MTELSTQLEPLRQTKSPFASPVNRSGGGIHWVQPRLVADVSFSQWTRDGRLRQPSFQGLREDKPAVQVARETPKDDIIEESPQRNKPSTKHRPSADGTSSRLGTAHTTLTPVATPGVKDARRPKNVFHNKVIKKGTLPKHIEHQLEEVTLTNPDRVLYPERGLTKLDLATYYIQVGETMLPYIVDRPLSLVRCPRSQAEQCFFQKHLAGNVPASLACISVREETKLRNYFAVKDLAGLLALVQLGVLEVHLWGAKESDLERPDRIVFDLDPGPAVDWGQVVEAATKLHGLLAEFDLKTFVKTTGGKGLHIVAPVKPRAAWAEAKQFCKNVVQQMAAAEPALYTINPSKRNGRVGSSWIIFAMTEELPAWPPFQPGLDRTRPFRSL